MNRPATRTVAACALVLSALGVTSGMSASAAASLKTYADKANHYSFQYPSSWKLDTKLADITGLASSMGLTTGAGVTSSDARALFAVAVKPSDSTMAVLRKDVTALIREGITLTTKITYEDQSAAYGGPAILARAAAKFDATHAGAVSVSSYVHNHRTYISWQAALTKPRLTPTDLNQLVAVVKSYVSD